MSLYLRTSFKIPCVPSWRVSDSLETSQVLRLTISFQADTMLSMYKYDGKKATTPSGTALQYSTRSVPKLRTTAGSFRTSNRDEISTWSDPRVTTCTYVPSGQLGALLCPKESTRPTHQGQETVSRERHDVGFEYCRIEAEHLGVHVERRKSPRSDDDRGEALKDGSDGEGGVEADEVKDWIRHGGIVRLERLEQESEACLSGGSVGWLDGIF